MSRRRSRGAGADTSAEPVSSHLDEYRHHLDDTDMTEEQKTEFLEAVWFLVGEFVSVEFGTHPVQQAMASRKREPKRPAAKPARPKRG